MSKSLLSLLLASLGAAALWPVSSLADGTKTPAAEAADPANRGRARPPDPDCRQQLEQSRREAEEQRQRAEALLYLHRINLAERAWQGNQVARAEEILDECPADLRHWEWHYLKRLCHAEHFSLLARNTLEGVAFGPDGKWLTTVSDAPGRWPPTVIQIWDAASGKPVVTLRDDKDAISELAFRRDGRRLVLASRPLEGNPTLATWDLEARQKVRSVPSQAKSVAALAFRPDGKGLATADQSKFGPDHWVQFSPDGTRLASDDRQGVITVWDAVTGPEIKELFRLREATFPVAFSSNGRFLASGRTRQSGRRNYQVTLWDLTTGKERSTLGGHVQGLGPNGLAFSPNGKRLASADESLKVMVWDLATGEILVTLRDAAHPVFSPDGTRLAVVARQGKNYTKVKVWDLTDGPENRTLRGHNPEVNDIAFSPDGKRLAVGSGDKDVIDPVPEVQVWDPATGKAVLSLAKVWWVAYSPDGKLLAAEGNEGMVIFDASSGKQLRLLPKAEHPVHFSPDGKHLVTNLKHALVLWEVADGKEIVSGSGPFLGFTPDGKHLLVGHDAGVAVWDATTGKEVRKLKGVPHHAASPDGKYLVQFCDGPSWLGKPLYPGSKEFTLWDVASEKTILTRPAGTGVWFVPDGKHLVLYNPETHLETVIDLRTGKDLYRLSSAFVTNEGTFSPDGSRFAIDQEERQRFVLFDMKTSQEVLGCAYGGAVKSSWAAVKFSPDGKYVAAIVGGEVKLWNATPMGQMPAGSLAKAKRNSEDELALREAIRRDPQNAARYAELGDACYGQSKWSEAEAAFKDAVRLAPNNAEYHNRLGNARYATKSWYDAAEAYREAVRLDANNARYHLYLGNALSWQNQWPKAGEEYRQVVKLDPTNVPAHAGLGEAYAFQKKWAESEAMYRKAAELEPRNGEWHAFVARALLQQGRGDEALQEGKTAVELGYKDKDNPTLKKLGLP